MSLINDALKKAKLAQENAPAREAAPQLRPSEPARPQRTGSSPAVPLLIAAGVLMGAGILWAALSGHRPIVEASGMTSTAATKTASTEKPDAKTASHSTVTELAGAPDASPAANSKTPEPVAATVTTPPPAVTVVAPAVVTPVPVATAALPESTTPTWPKLQGIFYRPSRPVVILNGKSVEEGGRVGPFTVLAITAQNVTLTGAGQTNVLSLSE